MITQYYPAGTPVYVYRPKVRGWPQPAVRGVVTGYTADGRVKVDTGTGIKVYAARNLTRRYPA